MRISPASVPRRVAQQRISSRVSMHSLKSVKSLAADAFVLNPALKLAVTRAENLCDFLEVESNATAISMPEDTFIARLPEQFASVLSDLIRFPQMHQWFPLDLSEVDVLATWPVTLEDGILCRVSVPLLELLRTKRKVKAGTKYVYRIRMILIAGETVVQGTIDVSRLTLQRAEILRNSAQLGYETSDEQYQQAAARTKAEGGARPWLNKIWSDNSGVKYLQLTTFSYEDKEDRIARRTGGSLTH